MTNPYAPPQAIVRDIADPSALVVPADRGTRLGASILDGMVFAAMVYMPILFGMLLTPAANAASDPTRGASLVVPVLLAFLGFIVWSWLTLRYVTRNSQSIGKKILNIKVVRSDGSPISLGRLFWLRNIVNMLLSIIPLYTFIDALFIFGESRQCLHDKIADSIVVAA
jgi:uncharacterized RDD family membrane protein YckC